MHFAAKSLLLKDSEQRWQRRFEDAKRQEDASHARRETWTWTILDHSHKLPKKGLRFHGFTVISGGTMEQDGTGVVYFRILRLVLPLQEFLLLRRAHRKA